MRSRRAACGLGGKSPAPAAARILLTCVRLGSQRAAPLPALWCLVMPGTKLQEHTGSDKAWVWSTVDFSEGEQRVELFCIRFGTVESESLGTGQRRTGGRAGGHGWGSGAVG